MSTGIRHPRSRARRHGPIVEPAARRELERGGWRTTLDYRENHVRALDGRLLRVEPLWVAEAERFDGEIAVASRGAANADDAWAGLLDDIAAGNLTRLRRVRLASGTV